MDISDPGHSRVGGRAWRWKGGGNEGAMSSLKARSGKETQWKLNRLPWDSVKEGKALVKKSFLVARSLPMECGTTSPSSFYFPAEDG